MSKQNHDQNRPPGTSVPAGRATDRQWRPPASVRKHTALPLALWFSIWLCVFGGCAGMAGYKVRTVELSNVTFLLIKDVAGYCGLNYSRDENRVFLRSKEHELVFTLDRRECRIDGITVNLSVAPVLWRGSAMLSDIDFCLLLDPLLRPQAVPRRSVRRIVIDPGHGGRDQGAATKTTLEKDICLVVAQKVAASLRRLGYDAQLTRNSDRALTLAQRAIILDRLDADLFISLHSNFAQARNVKGIETFLLTPRGTASTYARNVSNDRKRGNQFDRTNARLAFDLHRNLLAGTHAADRGLKHANFLVLREASCPAVLVEMGFISNAGEEKNMVDAAYQDRLVAGLVAGVRAFHRNVDSGR